MYLSVFIYSVEAVGPRNVRPIKTLGPSVLIGFPTCLSMYVLAYLCTLFVQTGCVISAFTHTVQTEQEWQTNINNPIFLPGIVVLFLYYKVFSPVNDTWCSPVVPNPSPRTPALHILHVSLSYTPDSDNQLIRSELRAWTVFRLTWSLHSVLSSLLPEQGKSVEVYFTSEHSLTDLLCAASSHTDETY